MTNIEQFWKILDNTGQTLTILGNIGQYGMLLYPIVQYCLLLFDINLFLTISQVIYKYRQDPHISELFDLDYNLL